MENKLSITEIRYIRTLASKKTDEELAEMINKPVGLIQMQFALMSGLPKRPWEKGTTNLLKSPQKRKIRSSEKQLIREQKKADKAKKADKNRQAESVYAQEQERLRERKKKLEKSILPTRQQDLSDRILVKLNARTYVYVKPGTDIDKLKKQLNIK